MLTQLNPLIPVLITDNQSDIPVGPGLAFALIDYTIETDILWGVALNETGEVWWVNNKFIRFQQNKTAGRTFRQPTNTS